MVFNKIRVITGDLTLAIRLLTAVWLALEHAFVFGFRLKDPFREQLPTRTIGSRSAAAYEKRYWNPWDTSLLDQTEIEEVTK